MGSAAVLRPNIREIAVAAVALAIADAAVRVHEIGGANRGPDVEHFQAVAGGVLGESWCEDYAFARMVKAYCAKIGLLTGPTGEANQAILVAHADSFAKQYGVPRTGSCQAAVDAAKKLGRLRDKHFRPAPGDLVYFDFPVNGSQLGRAHHVEFVVSVVSAATIKTVGGNTRPGVGGNQGEGDGVYQRTRGTEFVYGYVHW